MQIGPSPCLCFLFTLCLLLGLFDWLCPSVHKVTCFSIEKQKTSAVNIPRQSFAHLVLQRVGLRLPPLLQPYRSVVPPLHEVTEAKVRKHSAANPSGTGFCAAFSLLLSVWRTFYLFLLSNTFHVLDLFQIRWLSLALEHQCW